MRKTLLFAIIIIFITAPPYLKRGYVGAQTNQEVDDIQRQIDEQEQILKELRTEAQAQQEKLQQTQEYAGTLRAQIDNFSNQIKALQGKISVKNQEILTLQLAIQKLEIQTQQKEAEINKNKERMINLFQEIYQNDEESTIELLFKYNSFSTFFNQVQARNSLNDAIKLKLEELKKLKEEFEKAQNKLD